MIEHLVINGMKTKIVTFRLKDLIERQWKLISKTND